METNDEPESFESVSINPEDKVNKLSHVCIFADCKKGKRGGSEYCNHHRKIGEEGRKKLKLKLENNNLRKKKKSQPSIIIDPYEMDISNIIDPYEMDLSNIDLEPDKHTNLSFGIMFILFSFMSFIIAIESDDGICGMLGMFSFVIGSIFSLSATEGKKDIAIFFIVICGFFLLLFAFMIDSMFSSRGCFGVCGLSGWGGP